MLTDIVVYPNPVYNTLHLKNTENIQTSLLLYDMDGRLVMERAQGKHTAISLAHLQKGLYLLQVHNDNKIKVFKVLKE